MLTPKQKRERRRKWARNALAFIRLYVWCVIGMAATIMLPDLSEGIKGAKLYIPTFVEALIACAVAFVIMMLDEELGGDKIAAASRSARVRKRKHALLVGFSALAGLARLLGN